MATPPVKWNLNLSQEYSLDRDDVKLLSSLGNEKALALPARSA
jgi:hypothetical protein